jgi:hypothetical protein
LVLVPRVAAVQVVETRLLVLQAQARLALRRAASNCARAS